MSGICRPFVVVLALSSAAFAVDAGRAAAQPNHSFSVGGGLRGDAVREDLVVPLTFSGPGGRLMLGYRGVVGPGMLSVRADMGLAFLFNRYGRIDAAVRHASFVESPSASEIGRGWSFGVDVRFARTTLVATNINLSACLYAAWSWGL